MLDISVIIIMMVVFFDRHENGGEKVEKGGKVEKGDFLSYQNPVSTPETKYARKIRIFIENTHFHVNIAEMWGNSIEKIRNVKKTSYYFFS